MIKRYGNELDIEEVKDGDWVTYEDYLSLQAALREALDQWDSWLGAPEYFEEEVKRIAELRKLLDI